LHNKRKRIGDQKIIKSLKKREIKEWEKKREIKEWEKKREIKDCLVRPLYFHWSVYITPGPHDFY
jgi:hypothetical protein